MDWSDKTRELLEVYIGQWRKFTTYEVRGGFIRPAQGAILEDCDPWDEYEQCRVKSKALEAPYWSLIKLIDGISLSSDPGMKLSEKNEIQIVEWCNKHGLLGLLLQNTLMAVQRARWEPNRFSDGQIPLVPTTHTLIRINGGWTSEWDAVEDGRVEVRLAKKNHVVADEYFPTVLQTPGVLEQALGSNRLRWSTFSDSWGLFFPDVPSNKRESFQYPTPLSDAFWHSYAEPVRGFWTAAAMFRDMVKSFAIGEPISSANPNLIKAFEAQQVLHALLGPVAPTLTLDENGLFRPEWSCASLLASFSMMFYRDLTEFGKRIVSCRRCKSIFVTSAWQALYCSERCRSYVQTKRKRDKEKARKQAIRRNRQVVR
jgi:hypothetical protein